MNLKGKQRSYLRSLAHHFEPSIYIGKNRFNKSIIKSINKILDDHELIKIKILNGNKEDYISDIIKYTNSIIVGGIGKILIVYRQSKVEEKRKIKIPR